MLSSDTLLLLALYWRLDQRAEGGVRWFVWARRLIIGGVFIGFSISGGIVLATIIKSNPSNSALAEAVPALLLTLILLSTTVSGFNQALQALYLSDDLERLLVAPIRSRSIVTAKLLGRLPMIMIVLLAVAMPALLAFGFTMEMGIIYYFLAIMLLLAAPLFGISLGALVAILMVRILPAQRLSEWVGAASIVIGTLFSILFYLPRMMASNEARFSNGSDVALEEMLDGYSNLPLPTHWAGRALIDLGEGRLIANDFVGLFIYFLITIGFFLMTILVADRLYLQGWLRMQSSGARTQGLKENVGIFGVDSLDLIIGYKDWLLRVRDARLLATIFSGLIFAVFLFFMMFRPQSGGASLLSLSETAGGIGILEIIFSKGVIVSGMIYGIAWSVFSRIARSALSIEREAAYMLKSMPISSAQILRAKVLGILLPYLLFVTILLIAFRFAFEYSLLWMPYAWFVLLIMGIGEITFSIAIDFIYPNLKWEDPRKMTTRKAALPSLIGTALYSVIAMATALATFALAAIKPPLAIPAVLFGLGLLTGGTWFFVGWCARRVEAAWLRLGAE